VPNTFVLALAALGCPPRPLNSPPPPNRPEPSIGWSLQSLYTRVSHAANDVKWHQCKLDILNIRWWCCQCHKDRPTTLRALKNSPRYPELVGWGLTALLTQNRSYRACKFVGIFHSKDIPSLRSTPTHVELTTSRIYYYQCYQHSTKTQSPVFCRSQHVYDIFNTSCLGVILQVRPWWHVYTTEWCGCILTVSRICQGGFPLPYLRFSSSWVSFS